MPDCAQYLINTLSLQIYIDFTSVMLSLSVVLSSDDIGIRAVNARLFEYQQFPFFQFAL